MPTIAFWNLAGNRRLGAIVELIEQYGVEILAVAEQAFDSKALTDEYGRRLDLQLYESVVLPKRVRFYTTLPLKNLHTIQDEEHFSIKEYQPSGGLPLLVVGVHLASKARQNSGGQSSEARRLSEQIERAESLVGHSRTLVIGDFNMDPFDDGMVNSDGLHGVMDRRVAAAGSRVVQGRERPFFYNPMWKHMGDGSAQALGTFYRGPDSYVSYFWHTFDQVLLRPSLLAVFREEELRVVDAIGDVSLLSKRGPGIDAKISDHLPICLTIHS